MVMTASASWINEFFFAFDSAILTALHNISNGFLTLLFKTITLIGEKGILFFLLALIFMCFKNTRRLGVCIFGAVACGALITNIILKDTIARPRPFETVDLFRQYWEAVGSPAEDGFSFPSGHVTAAAAGMVAIRLMQGKKWTIPAILWIVIMMVARNYLMAHYPSDVIVAAIVGTFSAIISFIITKAIFNFLEKSNLKLAQFLLNFDLPIGAKNKNLGYQGKHSK